MTTHPRSLTASVGRGVVAGLAGSIVMSAFQKFIEMPITGREDSYAPASLAEKLLPVHPKSPQARKRLNWVAHFAIGAMWGAGYGVAAYAGLRGLRAVAAVFGTLYTGDVLFNTAIGLAQPKSWSRQDWAVDLTDKLVLTQATGAVFDRMLERASAS
jgi:hypothetical protein